VRLGLTGSTAPYTRHVVRPRLPLTRFREARQEARRRRDLRRKQALYICAAALVVLAPVIAVGAILENRAEVDTAAPASTQAASTTVAPVSADQETTLASEPPSPEREEPTQYDDYHLQFGQTAYFISRAGGSNTPLEFTVSAPQQFRLSRNAILFEADSPVTMRGKRQPVNVYFTVTVKNTSKTESWDADFLFSSVTGTGDDDVVSEVRDGDVDTVSSIGNGRDLRPGESATVKDGFSVRTADDIQYELDVDGLAGQSFYWTK
jgi:hypothetical protein